MAFEEIGYSRATLPEPKGDPENDCDDCGPSDEPRELHMIMTKGGRSYALFCDGCLEAREKAGTVPTRESDL